MRTDLCAQLGTNADAGARIHKRDFRCEDDNGGPAHGLQVRCCGRPWIQALRGFLANMVAAMLLAALLLPGVCLAGLLPFDLI